MNQQIVSGVVSHPRLVVRKDRVASANVIFGGWGPKMMALALAATALASSTGRSDAAAIVTTQHGLCSMGMAPPALADTQAPGWPNDLTAVSGSGNVTVRVTVDTSAHVTRTAIEKSSGDFAMDQDARQLLSIAKFASSDALCATKPGDYAFVVEYQDPGQ